MSPFRVKLVLCAVFGALLAGGSPWAAARPERRAGVIRNIVYGQTNGHDLLLDLYQPAETSQGRTKPLPVVLFLHGGGWRSGDKAEGARLADELTRAGIALASANYRLSGEATWPAPIIDAKTAVRFLRANAHHYGLDPTRIGACGLSAGGHLAALLGTTSGVTALEDLSQGSPRVSDRVQAVCDVSGPTDLSITRTLFIGRFYVRRELGGPAAEKPDLVRQANPAHHVHGGEPPFLLIYGARDSLVVPEHAERLERALRAHGDDVTLDLVPGGGHVPFGEQQRQEAVAFFQKHLSAPRP